MSAAISLLTAERDAMAVEIASLKDEKKLLKQSNRRAATKIEELQQEVREALTEAEAIMEAEDVDDADKS